MFSRTATSDQSINFSLIVPSMIASTHKQAVRLAAQEMAKIIGISERILAERLLEQENEKPSAIGGGVAISHLQLSGLREPMNIFTRLKNPIPMKAPDNMDVDIVCYVLTPEREGSSYLRTMARLSRMLRNPLLCQRLRAAENEKEIGRAFEQSSALPLAA